MTTWHTEWLRAHHRFGSRLVVIPYVGGFSEATERIFWKYGISTAVKPYKTLRNLLVHPKDKRTIGPTGECVYKIPCHNCNSMYIGETGRSYAKRQQGHRKEVESISNRTLTRADRKDLATETNKSAITDHAAKENRVIDWSGAKILDREGHRRTRQLKESIRIHTRRPTVWTEMRGPITFQRPMTAFWSRAHRQRHVTICLMKFAVGKRDVAIR